MYTYIRYEYTCCLPSAALMTSGLPRALVRYKHFERWAMGADFPLANIINNGSSLPATQRGALSDLQLVLDTKRLAGGPDDVMVVAGDMMFQVRDTVSAPDSKRRT